MNKQDAQAVFVCKGLEQAYILIVGCIHAVSGCNPDLLQRIDDDEPCRRLGGNEALQLNGKSVVEFVGYDGEF